MKLFGNSTLCGSKYLSLIQGKMPYKCINFLCTDYHRNVHHAIKFTVTV